MPVSVDFLPSCIDSKLKLPSMSEPNDSRWLENPESEFNEGNKFSMLFLPVLTKDMSLSGLGVSPYCLPL